MGILLVFGFLITLAGAWMKFQGKKGADSKACSESVVELKGKGKLLHSETQDGKIILTFAPKTGEREFVLLDSCTGKQLSNVKILLDKD
jgi:hypothetical protein